MGILKELHNIIEREIDDIEDDEDVSIVRNDRDEEEEDDSSSDVAGILKHIEAVQDAARFIDKFTTDEASNSAFEAEISLRKAIGKMQDLSDEIYKKKNKKKEI